MTAIQDQSDGFSNDGNVLYRNDLVNTTYSQVYAYDSLNRLTGYTQGTINSTLNGITGTPTNSGTYTMDAVGNMTTYGSGSRTVNAQNELTSGRYDQDSQTYLFDNRNYAPVIGAWMEQDPAGYAGGLNTYEFVNSNPIVYEDPLGTQR